MNPESIGGQQELQGQNQQEPQVDQQKQQQSNQQQQQQNQQPPYTIPGILHYIQYEWHRFEVERQEWEVEKAELSARIALLQGEKKAHENLKHDLIRRIKMLEYCLRMERAKYHKLKHGTDPPPLESHLNQSNEGEDKTNQSCEDGYINNGNNNSSTVTYGRELLRHYLQEIGYTDTIIDLRSNRVRSLLGIVDNQSSNQQQQPASHQQQEPLQLQRQQQQQPSCQSINPLSTNNSNNSNIDQKTNNNNNSNQQATTAVKRETIHTLLNNNNNNNKNNNKTSFNSTILSNDGGSGNKLQNSSGGHVGDAEASVLATFEFLYDREAMKDSNQLDDEEEDSVPDDVVDAADRAASTSTSEYSYFDKDHSEATAMIRQKLDLLNNGNSTTTNISSNSNLVADSQNTKLDRKTNINDQAQQQSNVQTSNAKNWCPTNKTGDVVDIGELATLTTLGSESNVNDDYSKKQWIAKYRLQSHYDCVRALCFSESESLLVTASEDETIKLWHLLRPSSNSNNTGKSRQPNLPHPINAIGSLEGSTLDIEPLHTYRGHTSRILSVIICRNYIFSGAQNGELIMWKLISNPSAADQYDKFDSSLLVCKFVGHDDAVWSLETVEQQQPNESQEPLLCSGSADKTIKLWNISGSNKEPIGVIKLDSSPTCIVKMPLYNVCNADADIAVSTYDGKIRLYELASCINNTTTTNPESNTHPIAIFASDENKPMRINSIVIHPTLPYMASADSNHDIKFWDLKTRKCKSTMVAHLDEVTSLACDSSGKYLLSASHDCSVRLWLFEEKSCIQEITSHRKKYDEGIYAVAFHPNLPQFATAGADGLAKVFI